MQKQIISFDQLPAAIYQLSQDVSELKRLLIEQPTVNNFNHEEKPLNVGQAAEYLGIAKQTLYQNIARIPSRKRFGRLFFFRSELTEYLNEGKGAGL